MWRFTLKKNCYDEINDASFIFTGSSARMSSNSFAVLWRKAKDGGWEGK